jgi:hypothetical protein
MRRPHARGWLGEYEEPEAGTDLGTTQRALEEWMGRRRRRLPWGSLVLGVLCIVAAVWALVTIPGAASGERGSFVATPARVVMPETPTTVPAMTGTTTPGR